VPSLAFFDAETRRSRCGAAEDRWKEATAKLGRGQSLMRFALRFYGSPRLCGISSASLRQKKPIRTPLARN